MVPQGASLSFAVDGGVKGGGANQWISITQSPDEVRSGVIDVLRAYVTVDAVTLTPTTHVYAGVFEWQYRALVTVRTKVDHARAEDVGAIVANAFYQAAGRLPTVTVTSETHAPAPGGVVNPGAGVLDQIGNVLGGVQSTVIIVGLAVVAGAVILLREK